MAETTVKSKVVQCPLGNGRMMVDIDNTCKICPYFKEIMPKNKEQGIVARVHCVVPTKFHRDIFELTEINFDEG